MIQARFGVFETNSSSTHAVALISADDRKRWMDGDYVNFNDYFIGIKSREEIIDMLFDKDSEFGAKMRKVINTDFRGEAEFREVDGKITLWRVPFEPSYPGEEEKNGDELFKEFFATLEITSRNDIYDEDEFTNGEEINDDVIGPDGKEYIVVGYWARG